MKRIAVIFAVILGLTPITTTTIVLTQAGCSTSAQRTTVNSLFTVGNSANEAYKSFLDGVVAGTIPTNSVPVVSKRYAEFQSAFNAAVTLAAFNTNAPPTPEVENASSQLKLSINAAKGK